MNEYRQNAINHLKTHLGCVGYRDYLITELEKLDKIEQIVKDSGNFRGENTAHDKYVKIAEIILEQE